MKEILIKVMVPDDAYLPSIYVGYRSPTTGAERIAQHEILPSQPITAQLCVNRGGELPKNSCTYCGHPVSEQNHSERGRAAVPDEIAQATTAVDMALKFSLCHSDHAGTRNGIKKAQAEFKKLMALLTTAPNNSVVKCLHHFLLDADGNGSCRLCGAEHTPNNPAALKAAPQPEGDLNE